MNTAHQNILHRLFLTQISPFEARQLLTDEVIMDNVYLSTCLKEAAESQDIDRNNSILMLYWLNESRAIFEEEFNLVLKNPYHYQHQKMLKYLQDELKYASSVPVIEYLLKQDLPTFFEYTGSDESVIVKWFSHALKGIGAQSAIDLIESLTASDNTTISNEMKYRLSKV